MKGYSGSRRSPWTRVALAVAAAAGAGSALACPVCDTPQGTAIREGLRATAGPRTVGGIVLPFAATLAVGAAFAGWGGGARRVRRRRSSR